jgi:uncharacterized membrane protein YdjX (TVP38/TMEM64 family)
MVPFRGCTDLWTCVFFFLAMAAGVSVRRQARNFASFRLQMWMAESHWGPLVTMQVMLLMRLGPFPHQLLNYVAATSRDVGYFPYISGSVIGNVPDCVIQVFVGNSFQGILDAVS